MLLKLAWRGTLRNARDYLIYLITVSLSFALVYAFNTLVFSQEFRELNAWSENIVLMILLLSVLVVLILGWLVSYMTGFILSKRSRELGLYMLLGIKRSSIALLFLLENALLGGLALLLGLLIGTGIYQVLISATTYIFRLPYEIVLTFSPQALGYTLFYILGIYLFAALRNILKLRRIKIRDLLRQDGGEAAPKHRFRLRNLILFLFSIFLLIFGCVKFRDTCTLTNRAMGRDLVLSLSCLILGLYLFYANLSALIVRRLLRRVSFSYRKDRLLLLRGLSNRLNSMGTTLGTLSMLFMVILTSFQAGLEIKAVFDLQEMYTSPYDVVIYSPDTDFSAYRSYLEEELGVEARYVYPTYVSDSDALLRYFENLPLIRFNYNPGDVLLSVSDYNALRALKGLDPVELLPGHYILSTTENVPEALSDPLPDLSLRRETLAFQAVYTDPVLPSQMHVCIVPDACAKDYPADYYTLVVHTQRETTDEDYLKICQAAEAFYGHDTASYSLYYGNVRIQGSVRSEGQTYLLMIVFALFYVGLVLVCSCAAILATRQMSDTVQRRYHYKILSYLGFSQRRVDRYLWRQLFIYFGVPLLIPLPLSIYASYCLHNIMRPYVTDAHVLTYAAITIGFFLFVYLIYLAATYIGCRKNIQEGWHPLD